MSENEDRDSGKIGAFLRGFLVGVLVCLGAGGTIVAMQWRQIEMRQAVAMEEAMVAREIAHEAEARAQAERDRAEKLLRDGREKKEK